MYGFQAKSDNDILILDGEHYNYHRTGGEDGTYVTYFYPIVTYYHDLVNFPPTTNVPIVIVRPIQGLYSLVEGYAYSGGQYTGFYVALESHMGTHYSGIIDWRLYEAIKTHEAIDYGIRLRNSQGKVFYDSSYKPFKVRQVHTINLPGVNYTYLPYTDNYYHYVDISHPNIYNPFYILMPHGMWKTIQLRHGYSPYTVDHFWLKTGLKKLSATSVRVGWFTYMWDVSHDATIWYNQGYNPPLTLLVCEE